MANTSRGVDLMRDLQEGRTEYAPSAYLLEVREAVSTALDELIEVGARIRPLILKNQRVGWVRGVHLSERKALKRWVSSEVEFINHLVRLGTTLTDAEIASLNLVEVRSVCRVIQAMTESDLKLYSFVSPFVTTRASEQLWYSCGAALASYRERQVRLPDGKVVNLSAPPDQARLWATLANYRIEAKLRLDASMNAVLTIRPLVGKGADPIAADLRQIALGLQTDATEPWREFVSFTKEKDFADGWAHGEDNSKEGILRELNAMMSNDRHEQVMAKFDEQELDRAKKRKEEIETRISKRGGPGFNETTITPMSRQQVADRARTLQQAQIRTVSLLDGENESSPVDRLAKYR